MFGKFGREPMGGEPDEPNKDEIISKLGADPKLLGQLLSPDQLKKAKELLDEQTRQKEKEHGEKREKRNNELDSWLIGFNVPGLGVGEPKVIARGIMEQVGLYIGNKHIGDIYSSGMQFSKEEFIGAVKIKLDQSGIEYSLSYPGSKEKQEQKTGLTLNIDPSINFGEMGIKIEGNILYVRNEDLAHVDLYSDGENSSVTLKESGDKEITLIVQEAMNRGGRLISYKIKNGFLDLASRTEHKI